MEFLSNMLLSFQFYVFANHKPFAKMHRISKCKTCNADNNARHKHGGITPLITLNKPITGPTDMPNVVDKAKYPMPSPLLCVGVISTAMVEPDTVVNPQVSPCAKRSNIIDVIVMATR